MIVPIVRAGTAHVFTIVPNRAPVTWDNWLSYGAEAWVALFCLLLAWRRRESREVRTLVLFLLGAFVVGQTNWLTPPPASTRLRIRLRVCSAYSFWFATGNHVLFQCIAALGCNPGLARCESNAGDLGVGGLHARVDRVIDNGGQLRGVIVLGPRRSGESYAPDESAAIAHLAHNLGAAIDVLSNTSDGTEKIVASIDALRAEIAMRLPAK